MALHYPISGGRESQQFGPVPAGVGGREFQPAMYGNADYAYWQPYKGWPWVRHFHNGLDISAGEGTPIYASEAGTVRVAGFDSKHGGGWVVAVEIKSGVRYIHSHCSQIHVAVGQRVARGQLIARVGATGTVTGNHSHFTFTVFERDAAGVGRTIYHNPKHYLPHGKWQNSPLISTGSTWGRVANDGVNIRTTAGALYARGVNGRIRRYSDNADLGATTALVAFGGFVSGSSHGIAPTPNEWARLWYGNAYRLVARPLAVIGGTAPAPPSSIITYNRTMRSIGWPFIRATPGGTVVGTATLGQRFDSRRLDREAAQYADWRDGKMRRDWVEVAHGGHLRWIAKAFLVTESIP